MILKVILKIIGTIIFLCGQYIMFYPLIKIYQAAKKKPNEMVENVLKDINFSEKNTKIGVIVSVIGALILVSADFV